MMQMLLLAMALAANPGTPTGPVPLPRGELLELIATVRDPQGRSVALMLRYVDDPAAGVLLRTVDARGREEKRWLPAAWFRPSPYPGAPAVALAYRLERGAWHLIEVRATTAEACDARGVLALEASRWWR